MGRKRKKYNIDPLEYSFHELDVEYMRNDYNNEMVDALNQLPPDERSMMIMYITTGNNKTELARRLGCSHSHIRQQIFYLQIKLQEIIKKNQKKDELH